MKKRFVVKGTWIDKESGAPLSGIAELIQGTNRNGHAFELISDKRENPIPGTYPVGTIITGTMHFDTPGADMTQSNKFRGAKTE